MRIAFCIATIFLLASCGNAQKQEDTVAPQAMDTLAIAKEEKRYTGQQLLSFLDSVADLSTALLASSVSFKADSVFSNQVQMNKVISAPHFAKLKHAITAADERDRAIDLETATAIFGDIQVDSSFLTDRRIPVTCYSFDARKDDWDEYAICLGSTEAGEYGWSCVLYFFKGNRMIARHTIFHRYGLDLEHYKDSDGRTVIYYKENFGSGTGIWQFNFYFYKYYADRLIPILNELENGNLQSPWGARIYWLEATVIKTAPLTLKMVYYQELYDTSGLGHRIMDDSTIVQYAWDERSKTLVGNYEKAKINKPQTLTYFLADNELLFINTYHKTLRACLEDKTKRHLVLNYLNDVKNHYENN